MKKLLAAITLIAFLSSATEVHELFKLQHLVAHYLEHSSKESGGSIAEFLHIHYSHDHKNHKDEHHDKGCLPFQGDHGCQLNSITYFASNDHIELTLKQHIVAVEQQAALPNFSVSDYLSKIWQPPKLA
ncbi:hypothetical protein CNR22_02465 [Sphingobacteriaceae bacterium]|nr:hypothetical protein CNR22_02465 [Sphingobacteriaceae bacterium]